MEKRIQKNSEELFIKAKKYFPGGVNSPVRAFRSVGGTPLFIKSGEGCHIWDEDDNQYIDFCCSWGPLILGHNHPKVFEKIVYTLKSGSSFGAPTYLENELAELILKEITFIDKLRFVSSGTEAVMSALRLARGFTKRNKIIKFDGCYHGHSDSLLVKAGSGLVTLGTSSSAGVPESFANQTIVLPLHDIETVKRAFKENKDEIACIIIEPIPANNGLLIQDKEYLHELRTLCTEENSLLIFDEVISGFRVGFTGAAGYYDIKPDIVCYGKIIGGGLPVGAYGASEEIMSNISPDGPVYQAGTLSGNPVAMSAGIAQLEECLKPNFYEELEKKTKYFVESIQSHCQKNAYPVNMMSIASIFWFNFSTKKHIYTAEEISGDTSQFNLLYHKLLDNGVYFGPSAYEVGFVSAAHTVEKLNEASKIICNGLDEIFIN
ncbi:MAG: glutamate-1-semialdehyde 2,1-aminomutase [Flavobacteriia bacterium]|nr:glutamate-1-semialdehyde 2,1-aminomutase [Flavobacteriia bacterium]